MCGIAGMVSFNTDMKNQKHTLDAMTEKLIPRGPDSCGFWLNDHAALGHRRLIVVDPEGGIQPMIKNNCGNTYVLVYNGELYNTEDLRKELKSLGHSFRSTSDTEVLLVSYIEWGVKCLDKLNGIFAFAVWNQAEQTIFLARDRFGVKPLFYAVRNDTLIFASELKSLMANPMVEPKVDVTGLAEIFAMGPTRTPGNGVFKDVYEVKPAHYIIYSREGLRQKVYWQLQSMPHTDGLEETADKIRFLVTDSIERQLVSDVPICTFLSGGLDSSAITAVASKYFDRMGKGQLHTYSIDYEGNDKYFKPSSFQPDSDNKWIDLMSDSFKTYHHRITINNADLVSSLESALEARDLPGMADIDSSLLLFCREIKKEHVVSLSGECADEIFGGYPWFYRSELINSTTFPWSINMEERKKVLSNELVSIIKPEEYAGLRYQETLKQVPRLKGESETDARIREIFYLNITWFMSCLLERKDRMSMASGLEVRVPFCDHRLAQYAWNIPWDMKYMGLREKGLLREALEGILPYEIIERKKSPYPKTHNPAFENAVKVLMSEILNDSNSYLKSIVNLDNLQAALNSNSDYGKPWFGQLMAAPQMLAYLIQVEFWMKKFNVTII